MTKLTESLNVEPGAYLMSCPACGKRCRGNHGVRAHFIDRHLDWAMNHIARLQAQLKQAVDALEKCAAYGDTHAEERLATTGSYSSFDEPGSVEIARTVLAAISAREEKQP